ncbi:glycoside hydrolase family 43 protein [Arthrobacter sp. NPDC056691]|uniref:glycoside hydrolase family 43 protein n=1 Tax=Arthrobacter sp. NPDC056691 TaxID=3345913 RepID=UPI00366C3AF4
MSHFSNPAIAGFNPDPSVVLADGLYYLATSTFEYLPGIALYSSTDLTSWIPIGHVITRAEQADLSMVRTPGGVWAPTIRHHDGTFFVIVSIMFGSRGCVVYSADSPTGPWSKGVEIPAVDGYDPDLAWDDEGVAHVTFAKMGAGIQQLTVDLTTGRALEAARPMWSGTGLHAPESPHLYKHGEYWYLLIAEGGTERGHAVSIARGSSARGPFVADTANPILSARSTDCPIQNTGHADLASTPDGGIALVLLGVRPLGFTRSFSPLGRETFITDAKWVDGWIRPSLPVLHPPASADTEHFDLSDPEALHDPGWIGARRHPRDIIATPVTGRSLVLTGDGSTLKDPSPTFVGRRQVNLNATVSTRVNASAGRGGLAARHSEAHWFAVEAEGNGTKTRLTARAALAGIDTEWHGELDGNDIELRIESSSPGADPAAMAALVVGGDRIRLLASNGHDEIQLAELDGPLLVL